METRDVTVVFGGRQDHHNSVWRLQPGDQARLVLGPQAHEWLEENFVYSDSIRVVARRLDNDEIRITLDAVAGFLVTPNNPLWRAPRSSQPLALARLTRRPSGVC